MPYCQNCGSEMNGNFCPKCGSPQNSPNPAESQPNEHINATVKPRYGVFSVVLAGYIGAATLIAGCIVSIFLLVAAVSSISESDIGTSLLFLLTILILAAVFLPLAYLCYLPGLRSIKKNTPEDEIKKTRRSFIIKSFQFPFAFAISVASCVLVIGIVLRGWRLIVNVCTPKINEYTAFVDGKKISVTKIPNSVLSTYDNVVYMYVDANGERYYPPII